MSLDQLVVDVNLRVAIASTQSSSGPAVQRGKLVSPTVQATADRQPILLTTASKLKLLVRDDRPEAPAARWRQV